jgi:hypothetical protein
MKVMSQEGGMSVQIFKNLGRSYDGLGKFSSKSDFCIVLPSPDFPNVPAIFKPHLAGMPIPCVAIVKRMVCGKPYLTAYPVLEGGVIDTSRMFGGTYIASSDSRITEISEYPIPLHDRVER